MQKKMSQKGRTHFKNLAANAARSLKRISKLWDIILYTSVSESLY